MQRRSLLTRINWVMASITALLFVMAGLIGYSTYQVLSTTAPINEGLLPQSSYSREMLSSLRSMHGNAMEYLLREPEEALEFAQNANKLQLQLEHFTNGDLSHDEQMQIAELKQLLSTLVDQYQKRVFSTYDPERERQAQRLAAKLLGEIGAPLENRIDELAQDEIDDAGLSDFDELLNDDLPGVRYYLSMVDEAGDMYAAVERYLNNDPTAKNFFYDSALAFERWYVELQALEQKPNEIVELKEIMRLFVLFKQRGDELFTLYDPSSREVATKALDDIEHMYFSQAEQQLVGLSSRSRDQVQQFTARLQRSASITSWLLALCAAISFALLVFITRFIRQSIYWPIVRLKDAVELLRQGKRDVEIHNNADDELGDIFSSLTQFNDELAQLDELREEQDNTARSLAQERDRLENTLQELQQAQNKLVASEKMASLGSLVAGVAHEVNTPLGIAVTLSSTLDDNLKRFIAQVSGGTLKKSDLQEFENESRQNIKVMSEALDKASSLIHSFKQVAMDQSSAQRREFNLQETIQEVFDTLHHQVKRTNFKYHLECAEPVMMDSYPGPLGQVITNLFNNSLLHAFDNRDSGDIHVRIKPIGSSQVRIIFSDNGNGINEENLGKIFDPFFTTKLGQGGSGLGLNIVYNIVTGILGGDINVESNIGTTFTLTLPLSAPHGGQ